QRTSDPWTERGTLLRFGHSIGTAPEDRQVGDPALQQLVLAPLIFAGGTQGQRACALHRCRDRKIIEPLEVKHRLPARVAAEELVGSFTDLANDYPVLPRQLGHVIDRYADGI